MSYDTNKIRDNIGHKQIPPHKIIAWLERHFDCKTRKGGSEYIICSPFSQDTGFNFNIKPDIGMCHDWRSDDWSGTPNPKTGKRNCSFINMVRLYKRCSFRDAVLEVLGDIKEASDYLRPSDSKVQSESLQDIRTVLPVGVTPLAPAVDIQAMILKRWLYSRGYAEDTIQRANVHYSGMDVYWVYYEYGEMIYWQSRSRLSKTLMFPPVNCYKDVKLIGTSEISKGDVLYGFDDVDIATYVIITESIFCQNTLGDNCVASGGAALTKKQIQKTRLLDPRDSIILSPDNDRAGINSIISNASSLRQNGFKVCYSVPPKIEYEHEGLKKLTKDWNELFEFCKMSNSDIRSLHDRSIKELDTRALIDLHGMSSKRKLW